MVTGVQQFMLGTVLNNEKQARETLAAIRNAGYDGIELCGFMIRPTPIAVRLLTRAAGMPTGNGGKLDWPKLMREEGLRVISLHEDLDRLEKQTQEVLEETRTYQTNRVVLTGVYQYDYGSGKAVRTLAQRLNRIGSALAQGGVQLLYHNHNCELRRTEDGERAWDILLRETDPAAVQFELDTYWFTEGGADAKLEMQRLGDRFKLWHINDRGTRMKGAAITPILKTDSMELGTGNMDLAGLADLAEAAGVEAVILESHRNWVDKSPVRSLQVSAEWLNRRFPAEP